MALRCGLRAVCLSVLVAASAAVAEDGQRPPPVTEPVPGLRQTILQRFDIPSTRYETAIMRVEFPAGHVSPRHEIGRAHV